MAKAKADARSRQRRTWTGVVAALVVTAGAQSALGSSIIEVDCKVSGASSALAADFPLRFCAQLVASLSRTLGAGFSARPPSGWTAGRRGVVVRLRIIAADRADVTISTGRISDGGFVQESSGATTLVSRDRSLTPFSATTLVRDIGVRLGLAS